MNKVNKTQAAPQRFITTGKAAEHCQTSIPAIRSWIRDGRLRAFRTPGGHSRIELADFRRFLKKYGMPGYPSPEEARDSGPRVLVVEDDPEVRELLTRLLHSHVRGAVVETAADGYEALLKMGAFKPLLLLLDVVMPRVDGLEVCRRLRMVPETCDIRILAITGHAAMVDSAVAAGADACVMKPFDVPRLRREIDRLLPAGERKARPQ